MQLLSVLAVNAVSVASHGLRVSIHCKLCVRSTKSDAIAAVQEHGGELTADAIELQLKDNCGMMVPAVSFDSRGREMTIAEYGLKPGTPGAQHHIWALFVDDSAARIQRNAVDRILQPTGVVPTSMFARGRSCSSAC